MIELFSQLLCMLWFDILQMTVVLMSIWCYLTVCICGTHVLHKCKRFLALLFTYLIIILHVLIPDSCYFFFFKSVHYFVPTGCALLDCVSYKLKNILYLWYCPLLIICFLILFVHSKPCLLPFLQFPFLSFSFTSIQICDWAISQTSFLYYDLTFCKWLFFICLFDARKIF